ncbi:hypothetical protein HPB51_003639 [Rhipicephalus microplus]|uniref:Growth arrest-specific protein 1 n=1 Tax=Rhipicephalus microplus TaxID=6941 RepID=A0A9J6DYH5_RHIMP|nr:hypothetical protein HPB51_003639 [Rhipicephalus microplus]
MPGRSAHRFLEQDPVRRNLMTFLPSILFFAVTLISVQIVGAGVDCGGGVDVGASFSSTRAVPRRRTGTCAEAEQDCIGRLTCGMAFHGHRLDCKRELAGRTPGRCSVRCRQSLVSLASTEEGYAFIGCGCGEDDFCRALRLRLTPCWWQKPCATTSTSTANGTVFQLHAGLITSRSSSSARPQCSQLARDCVEDPVCSVAWDYYRRFCHEVLDGVADNCSTRCRNSVRILMRMEKAHRLLDCACDERVTRVTCGNELNRVRTACFRLDDIDPSGASAGLTSADSAVVRAILLMHLLMPFGW